MELRGHENVVEVVVFAPVVAYAAIQELASIEVSLMLQVSRLNFLILGGGRVRIKTRRLGNTSRQALETKQSGFGVVHRGSV
jgi:hypothetical protein